MAGLRTFETSTNLSFGDGGDREFTLRLGYRFTPGPWQYVPTKMGKLKTWHIACPTHVVAHTAGHSEANAALIAAAPEMLAALKLVSGLDIFHEALRVVDAAIAKAEGR